MKNRAIQWGLRTSILVPVILLQVALGVSSAAAARASKPRLIVQAVGNHLIHPRINVGEDFQQEWTAKCWDTDGSEIHEPVTWFVDGAPSTGDASATWDPPVGETFKPSVLTISTTTRTDAGTYQITITGKGDKCADSDPYTYPFDVAPVLDGDRNIWWFDQTNPDGYKTKGTLKAMPSEQGPYLWKIKKGTDKVRFPDGSTSVTTDGPSVKFKSTGPNGSKPPGQDIEISVTVNGVTSDVLKTQVRVPHKLVPNGERHDPDEKMGYQSIIYYRLLDQFKELLPVDVPWNEMFTTPVEKDRLDSDWVRGKAGGEVQSPAIMGDKITGQAYPSTPVAQKPLTPLGKKKIHHFTGEWRVGSVEVGKGRRVQINDWQRYQDHATHEAITSPAP